MRYGHAMRTRWVRHGSAMDMQLVDYGFAMATPCACRGLAMGIRRLWVDRGSVMGLPWFCDVQLVRHACATYALRHVRASYVHKVCMGCVMDVLRVCRVGPTNMPWVRHWNAITSAPNICH